MDESAAAVITEDDADKNYPHNDDRACENNHHPSADNPSEAKESSILCKDCGLQFKHTDSYLTHLHQHALEEEEAQLEEEEAQLEEDRPPATGQETREDRDEDMSSGADEGDESGSAQLRSPESTQVVPPASEQNTLRQVYSCLVCGKTYSYLESYRKHLKLHKDLTEPDQQQTYWSDPSSLRKYECPDCGMSFIRRTRLISHLRVHRSDKDLQSSLYKCDQCNKCFGNEKLWMAHMELHKQKRFWCLSCAQGFLNEVLLDKHLQRHSLMHNTPNTNDRSSQMADKPASQPDSQLKKYSCRYCEKSFCQSRQLNAHLIKHTKRYKGRFKTLKFSTIHAKVQKLNNTEPLKSVKGETEINTHMEELQTSDAAECGYPEDSEESDCGEPMHRFKLPKPPEDPGPETSEPRIEWNLNKNEPNVHREHKYWEWECIECDMGFDELAKLRLHYIKHATGEVPIPQHDPEG